MPPRKAVPISELTDKKKNEKQANNISDQTAATNVSSSSAENNKEAENLSRMLGDVLTYLSDDEVEEIDLEYLLNNTEGLREWWEQYREKNRKQIEDEIKKSLAELPLEDLEKIRQQIKENKNV